MLDILLDKDTHDLDIASGDLVLVDGIDRLIQQLKIRLETVRGEWFLDTTVGVPYYEAVWVKNPNLLIINALLKSTILSTEDIIEITSFQSTLNAERRLLTVSFNAVTTFGNISFTENL